MQAPDRYRACVPHGSDTADALLDSKVIKRRLAALPRKLAFVAANFQVMVLNFAEAVVTLVGKSKRL